MLLVISIEFFLTIREKRYSIPRKDKRLNELSNVRLWHMTVYPVGAWFFIAGQIISSKEPVEYGQGSRIIASDEIHSSPKFRPRISIAILNWRVSSCPIDFVGHLRLEGQQG
jgi:hypothetical protein